MSQNNSDYREKLYSQIQEEYGKVVYTYTCHHKFADRISEKNVRIKVGQIVLSAVSTGGFLGTLITNQQLLVWVGGLCSTVLLMLNAYLKDKDLASEKNEHLKAANSLWKIREEYLSLLTDFDVLTDSEIIAKRDALIDRCADLYARTPATDSKSYAAAQRALKSEEEQFFTQEELNKMLPQHLRKEEK